jgi:hypothetical protein
VRRNVDDDGVRVVTTMMMMRITMMMMMNKDERDEIKRLEMMGLGWWITSIDDDGYEISFEFEQQSQSWRRWG